MSESTRPEQASVHPKQRPARTKNKVESFLIALAIFVSACAATSIAVGVILGRWRPPANPEATWLEAKYGPARNSQFLEEWIIRDFFSGKRDGVFVDVGASHYRESSNTYYLETELGWSGLAIEPLRQFEADYLRHRPRTRFRPFFVSDRSHEEAKIYFLKDRTRVTSSDKTFTERYGKDAAEITSPTITLNDLLEAEAISKVDFLSMDIELAEPKALAGFDIRRFRPALVCIEAHPEVRQQILDYFAQRGYVVVGKYLRADSQNLYFTPISP